MVDNIGMAQELNSACGPHVWQTSTSDTFNFDPAYCIIHWAHFLKGNETTALIYFHSGSYAGVVVLFDYSKPPGHHFIASTEGVCTSHPPSPPNASVGSRRFSTRGQRGSLLARIASARSLYMPETSPKHHQPMAKTSPKHPLHITNIFTYTSPKHHNI